MPGLLETSLIRWTRLLGACLLLICPGTILADSAALLEQGMVLEEEVDFWTALQTYRRVLDDEAAPEEHRHLARIRAAFCLVALDRTEEAQALLVQVLHHDPHYDLHQHSSPKLIEAVEEARAVAVLQREEQTRRGFAGQGIGDTAPQAAKPDRARLMPWSAVVGAGAIAAVGAGVAYALSSQRAEDRLLNDTRSFDSHREALLLRDQAIVRARTANILFVSGAILAAGSGTLLFLDRSGTTVAAAPIPAGMMVIAEARW